jgi:hypothetical protein
MFSLDSQIPLVRTSSKSVVDCRHIMSSMKGTNPPISDATTSDPTLRANPFPKVTDPFCRLPLPTLFYQLEAVHLGDLLRLWVRTVAKANLLFPRIFKGRQERTGRVKDCRALPTAQPDRQSN